LRELTPGAARFDLNGRPAGSVSAKEAASAAARLQKPQGARFGLPGHVPQAVKLTRRLAFADPAEAARRKNAVEAKPQKVIVVLKKRKVSLGQAQQIDFRGR
jgi:sRNA-binding protein